MIGHDFLGLGDPRWKVAETIPALLPGCAIGCFDGVWPQAFGDPMPNVRKILASQKVAALRVHIWWGGQQHLGVPLPTLKKALPRWEKLAKDFPAVKIFVSPSCEYGPNTKKADVVAWVAAVRQLCPSCTPVLAPMNGPVIDGCVLEYHGTGAHAKVNQIASYDGGGKKGAGFDEEMGADVWMQQNAAALIQFAWSPIYNCAESHNTDTPNHRIAYPSTRYINALNRLMRPKTAPPEKSKLAKPELWKTFGEDQQGQNPRDNKPIAIIKSGKKQVVVKTLDGQQVATLGLFGNNGDYPGKLSRFYSGWQGGSNLWGFEIAARAKALSGSEWCYVEGRLIHPAFRSPFYQS